MSINKNLQIRERSVNEEIEIDNENQMVVRCPNECRFRTRLNNLQTEFHCYEMLFEDVIVGYIGLEILDDIFSKTAQICLRLNHDDISNFAMSQCLSAACRFLFKQHDIVRIEIGLENDDLSASSILTSVGFEEEGVLAKAVHCRGEFFDTHLYTLLK